MSDKLSLIKEVINFIDKSPTMYHAVSNVSAELEEDGYIELYESNDWRLENGGKYYVKRMSSVIAFSIPKKVDKNSGYMIISSHSDSPCFKIKPNSEISVEDKYKKLNVEKYGGMIYSSWLDRPLSVAGRLTIKTETGVETKLIDFDRDLITIPNPAIHLNHKINSGYTYDVQKDLLPLYSNKNDSSFEDDLASESNIDKNDIWGSDLFVYNRNRGTIFGRDNEFFSAPRIDNLECAYLSLKAFMKPNNTIPKVLCVFDNEEVGSGTKQGAKSTFLYDCLLRISEGFNEKYSKYLMRLASSFMLSADNGHALHPNFQELSCPTNRPFLNGGVLIKYNASQKYTTDSVSEAIFKRICIEDNIKYQEYVNRSNLAGGSTLGNLLSEKVSINTIDIGVPQLSMHSAYETAGVHDAKSMLDVMTKFYETKIESLGNEKYNITF